MKIAIVTLPLNTNYGGVLQAYALKTVLESMGHDVTVLDPKTKIWKPVWWKAPFIYLKRAIVRLFKGRSGPEVFRESRLSRELPMVSEAVRAFVMNKVKVRVIKNYNVIKEGEYDAFVVGSDQVWRPSYLGNIYDRFLEFTSGWNVKRVAYAASFGTTELEYEYTQLEKCSKLLEGFCGVSVREESALKICDEWFDCSSAVHVLDPVMLLPSSHYVVLAAGHDVAEYQGKVLSYILDKSVYKYNLVHFACHALGKDYEDVSVLPADKNIPLNDRIMKPLEQWIGAFAASDFVVTDSFHGCVLALLFHKPFLALGNKTRGQTRLDSLLTMFELEGRLVEAIDPDDDGKDWLTDINWERVDEILHTKVQESQTFLYDSLN